MNKLCTLLSCLFWLCLASCGSDDKGENKVPAFSIDGQSLRQDFQKEASFKSIPVATNLERGQWSVESSDPSWCMAAQDYSSSVPGILITVRESEEPDVRTAEITVKSVVQNYKIEVRQLGHGPAILLKDARLSVGADGGRLEVVVTSNVEYTLQQSEGSDWMVQVPDTRAFADHSYTYEAAANPTYEKREAALTYTYAADEKVTATCTVTQEAKSAGVEGVVVDKDVKIVPTGGQASECQPGQDIGNSYDGKFGSEGVPYHSIWGQPAAFPVTLEYFFDQKPDMDYIVYHTRSGNGNFGELDLYVATESKPEYELVGSYDFKMQNAASRIAFARTMEKVTKVKFSVKSGLGGFVSCDEMEFYRRNTDKKLETLLLTVFTDVTCCELKPGVTDEAINALPGYFAVLAMQLKNGTYDSWEKEFRMQEYASYSHVEEWAERLMTKRYSSLDNPTGIYVEAGDSVVILVGDTHGQPLSVQCIGEENTGEYVQTAASGEIHFLNEGVNKVGFTSGGMLFLMYTGNPSTAPVKVHIPVGSGRVNGFFDKARHRTNGKYQELIGKAAYKYFCVRGERIIFYFHRKQMQEAVPRDILSAIDLWDDIVGWQQELMGIDDVYPSQMNNHLFAISPEGSYMWASDYRIAFVYTYLNNILLRDNVMAAKDNAWGPAHEMGHIHQRAINWPGSTESSNNLFSNYVLYKLGKYCSRGSELSALATARCVHKQGWWNMGTATHQNEDTEIHMRMNWQLWNYYHRCGYKKDFWQTLFKLLREDRIVESNPGEAQLHFAMMASKAANENLTEFFDMWGFFEPVDNETIEQYGTWKYNVTASMIENAKDYMARFPAPKHAFYYLEDRKNGDVGIENYQVGDVGYYTQFKEDVKVTKKISFTQSGRSFRITDGDEAVAFELRRNGQLLYFSNFFNFTVPDGVDIKDASLYAVQADGQRIPL